MAQRSKIAALKSEVRCLLKRDDVVNLRGWLPTETAGWLFS
jgi:hypothetical protein